MIDPRLAALYGLTPSYTPPAYLPGPEAVSLPPEGLPPDLASEWPAPVVPPEFAVPELMPYEPPPRWQSGLAGLAGIGQPAPSSHPDYAAASAVAGFLRGLGLGAERGINQREMRRQQENRGAMTAAANRNEANLKATQAAEAARATITGDIRKRAGARKDKAVEYERDTIEVNGQRVPRSSGLGQHVISGQPASTYKSQPTFGPADRFNMTHEPVPGQPTKFRPVGAMFQQEMALRKEIESNDDVTQYINIRDSYTTGLDAAKQNNSLGDIILMRMVAKTTDPRTGVREEEFRVFEKAQGELAKHGVQLTRSMWGKGRLNDYGRAAMLQSLKDIYARKLAAHRRAVAMYRGAIADYGLNEGRILRDYTLSEDSVQSAPRNGAATADTTIRVVDGVRVRKR